MAPGSGIERLLEVVARLRGPGGCPWDRAQTLATLKPFLIEECYELLDAIDGEDPAHHAEELGDVLLQVVLQCQLRAEEGAFGFDAVAQRLADKLVRRHPHVFGDAQADTPAEVVRNWEAIKSTERGGRRSLLDGLPRHLPALLKAQKVQARAARVGFDWKQVEDVLAKVDEELAEVRAALAAGEAAKVREEVGDLLFAVVNLGRFQAVDTEAALEDTVAKFRRRFAVIEERVHAAGKELTGCSLEELDGHWNAAKAAERGTD